MRVMTLRLTHSCPWHDSFVTALIHVRDLTWPYSLRLTHLMSVTWLSSRCDLFICVIWLSSWRDSFLCVTWFRDWLTRVRIMTQFVTACIHMRDMTWLGTPGGLILCPWQYYCSVRESSRSCAWHESVRDVTYSYAWHASVCDVTHMREITHFATRLIHMRDMTRADSFMSVTCLICDVAQDSDFEKGDRPVALDWQSDGAVLWNVLQCVVVCCSVLHRPVDLQNNLFVDVSRLFRRVMSHNNIDTSLMWMSHVPYTSVSCPSYIWVISHIWVSHGGTSVSCPRLYSMNVHERNDLNVTNSIMENVAFYESL